MAVDVGEKFGEFEIGEGHGDYPYICVFNCRAEFIHCFGGLNPPCNGCASRRERVGVAAIRHVQSLKFNALVSVELV